MERKGLIVLFQSYNRQHPHKKICAFSSVDQLIAINELGETTFPDPESQRDVRDWHVACVSKANARKGMWRSPSEAVSAEAQRFPAVIRSKPFL
ncbi:hypothetical protein CH368_20000 [Leptospira levettii]|nr:hypothetical protein CH368_20000 [Leptospira levettii]